MNKIKGDLMKKINANDGEYYINLNQICFIKIIDNEIVIFLSNGKEIKASKSELEQIIPTDELHSELI